MNHLLLFGNLGIGEIVIIAFLILLLFGGKKILMKGIGKGVKSFKDGVNGIEEELNSDNASVSDNQKKIDKK